MTYLAFGQDYSTNIAKFFTELALRKQLGGDFPRILTQPNKISSVLKRMNDDKLIILSKRVSYDAGKRSYYELNPQIIQPPCKEEINQGNDDSSLIIPIEMIKEFLRWMDTSQTDEVLRQKRHERADEILRELIISPHADYSRFITFIGVNARKWARMGLCNYHPTLSELIKMNIREFDPIACGIRIQEIDEFILKKGLEEIYTSYTNRA